MAWHTNPITYFAFFVTSTRINKSKMVSKFVICALLITLAFAHGKDISNVHNNNEIISTDKQSRIIDIPLISAVFFLGCQIVGLVLSSVWSLVEYKLAVVSLLSSLVSWLLQHYVLVIIGTVAVLGLCAVTSIFSAEPVYEIDHVVRAVRSVDQGILQFSRLI